MNLLRSINPATNELLDSYAQPTDAEMMAAVDQSYLTFLEWRKTSVSERTAALRRTAELLDERQEELARLITLEMGKAIAEARGEIAKCAWLCRYYADNAENFLAPERVETEAVLSYLRFDPIGIVLAIMPWNFPFWQVFRFAAPALMAGNAGLLKHAANVSGCGRAIEGLFRDAGFPEGLFLFLPIGSERVAQLLQHPKVRAATLTGSEKAGRAVAREAGNLIKKTVLELGGSDAYLVLEDADLELAARVCAQSRLINAGQSCIGAKRFIVVEAVHDRFVELFREQLAAARLGDPLDEETQLGPLARPDLRDELHRQVQDSMALGAKCRLGGKIPAGKGAFYPPTLLTEVGPGMPAYHEELFGPVAAVIRANDEEHAIRLANDSSFGLGAAVFTKDKARGERIAAHELEAGSCFVNAFVRSDPRLPFGGVKNSGYGRELSRYGMLEFVNIKTVYLE